MADSRFRRIFLVITVIKMRCNPDRNWHLFAASHRYNMLSGPILKSRSRMLRLDRKPCLRSKT